MASPVPFGVAERDTLRREDKKPPVNLHKIRSCPRRRRSSWPARQATDALNGGDVERFLSFHTDDALLHIPGRSPFAGDHSGKERLRPLALAQAQTPTRTEIHDVLVSGEHAVMLGVVRSNLGGQEVEDRQVLVFHFRDDQISEVWVYPWDQYRFDEAVTALGPAQQG